MNSPVVLPGTTVAVATPSIAITVAMNPGAKILFSGDSLTVGVINPIPTVDTSYRWCAPLEATLTAAFTGAGKTAPTYSNTGVGGNTTTDWLAAIATDIAVHPTDYMVLIGVNDPFNHGGTPIPPATTQSNIAAGIVAMQAKNPGCRMHFFSNCWGATEHWPTGTNVDDAAIVAANTAIQAACAGNPFVQYHDIRTPLFTIDEPAQNPGSLATGVLIQNNGGYHPTKPAGQTAMSARAYAFLTLNLS